MSKGSNSKKQIDIDERMVIAELQKNSKVSLDKIAERCVLFQTEDIGDYRKIGGKQNNRGI